MDVGLIYDEDATGFLPPEKILIRLFFEATFNSSNMNAFETKNLSSDTILSKSGKISNFSRLFKPKKSLFSAHFQDQFLTL